MTIRNIITLFLFAPSFCFAQKDYVRISGKIENRNSDTLMIFSNVKVLKTILVDKNGSFSDTLNVQEGLYALSDNVEMTTVFLKNGRDFQMNVDAKKFDETLHYEGIGGKENNYLAKHLLLDEQFDEKTEMLEDESGFAALLKTKEGEQMQELTNGGFDPDFVKAEKEMLMRNAQGAKASFAKKVAIKRLKNSQSPLFSYENVDGGVTKLEDFKGKFVFIDIWATWCAPCIAEIPHLKKAEERYKEKQIVFLSLSVDYQKNKDKWKKFIADKNLTGVQVLADQAWQSQFIKDYAVTSIPRFIIIDPEGKVVDADAARPSSPNFIENLDKLLN
ncbi:TlpA disulfide reductase family protein [Dyadobacter sp. CY343]|uniref:TlpA family protein disulfide reductase n=1 Tax=Dyadobacter sp. CY343 TaxID=2907299 RepID=UPI001F414886|nr:TlpA disulfide reductase family protein [Dyadobacter sp. CY343]MCE7061857.1 TlpA family protein disulfide reductase [Dyadobacter sp. CY343]